MLTRKKNIWHSNSWKQVSERSWNEDHFNVTVFFHLLASPLWEQPTASSFFAVENERTEVRATLSRWVVIVDTPCENLSFWRACRQGRKHVSGILNSSCRPLGSLVLRGDPNKGQSSMVIRRTCRTEVRGDRASRRSPDRLQHHRSAIVWVPL